MEPDWREEEANHGDSWSKKPGASLTNSQPMNVKKKKVYTESFLSAVEENIMKTADKKQKSFFPDLSFILSRILLF